jgi:hypothetical protein
MKHTQLDESTVQDIERTAEQYAERKMEISRSTVSVGKYTLVTVPEQEVGYLVRPFFTQMLGCDPFSEFRDAAADDKNRFAYHPDDTSPVDALVACTGNRNTATLAIQLETRETMHWNAVKKQYEPLRAKRAKKYLKEMLIKAEKMRQEDPQDMDAGDAILWALENPKKVAMYQDMLARANAAKRYDERKYSASVYVYDDTRFQRHFIAQNAGVNDYYAITPHTGTSASQQMGFASQTVTRSSRAYDAVEAALHAFFVQYDTLLTKAEKSALKIYGPHHITSKAVPQIAYEIDYQKSVAVTNIKQIDNKRRIVETREVVHVTLAYDCDIYTKLRARADAQMERNTLDKTVAVVGGLVNKTIRL